MHINDSASIFQRLASRMNPPKENIRSAPALAASIVPIRRQSRDFETALADRRQYHPIDSPYTYVEATVSIDGVVFPRVGVRKKGFLGSLNSNRPSLKVKLNHVHKTGQIDGLTNLTFNNNQQDVSLISQFMRL